MASVLYISGPMRGEPDMGKAAFDSAKLLLLSLGYGLISPADLDVEDKVMSNRDYAYRDYHHLFLCDGIVMLPNWWRSIGATAEFFMARWIELDVYTLIDGRLNKTSYNDLIETFALHQLPTVHYGTGD